MTERGDAPAAGAAPPRLASAARWAAEFWISLLIRLAERFPGAVRALCPVLVRIAWWCSAPTRKGTVANARWLLGDSSSVAQRRALGVAVVGSFYDFLTDMGRLRGRSLGELTAEVDSIEGIDGFRAARARKRGAILVTAHIGSFEIGWAGLRAFEPRLHIVFRRDPMDLFEKYRSEQRRRLGVSEAAVDGGWGVWMGLRDALVADEVVMLQGDRLMPGQRGIDVRFFGGHIGVPTGPARLALVTGSPIIPVFSVRVPSGRIRIVIEEAVWLGEGADPGAAVEQATRAVSAAIERCVAAYPDQWLMIRPVWREDQSALGAAGHTGDEKTGRDRMKPDEVSPRLDGATKPYHPRA